MQVVDLHRCVCSVFDMGHNDFAFLGEAMTNSDQVGFEQPAPKALAETGVFKVSPTNTATARCPRQNAA